MKLLLKLMLNLIFLCASLAANSASEKCLDVLLVGEKMGTVGRSGQNLNDLRFELISNLKKSNPTSLNSMNITEAMALTSMLSVGSSFISTSALILIRVPISNPDYFTLLDLLVNNVKLLLINGTTAVNRLSDLREDTKDVLIRNTMTKIINASNSALVELNACKQ